MQHSNKVIHSLSISAANEAMSRFTTLLQNGITLSCSADKSIGAFLVALPGFDIDYLSNRVQTIFLDGDAIDNFDQPFRETHHTLALSAAMPGLAGAIFRRNSLCAALRKAGDKKPSINADSKKISIQLKLFNMIAQEKGPQILSQGGLFSGGVIIDFFTQRPNLFQHISKAAIDDTSVGKESLLQDVKAHHDYHVTISSFPRTEG